MVETAEGGCLGPKDAAGGIEMRVIGFVDEDRDPFAPERYAAWLVTAAVLIAVPLVFDPLMKNTFRQPKEILFRGGGILLLIVFAFVWTKWKIQWNWVSLRKPVHLFPMLILCWTIVTALTSKNFLLSAESLITVICSIAVFFGVRFAVAARRSLSVIDVALAGAVINAILAILQEFDLWQPFTFPPNMAGHMATTALLGNPNDVGTFLLVPTVACVVGVAVLSGTRRWIYASIAAILVAGLLASGTRTALIALPPAVIVVIAKQSRRVTLILVPILALAVIPVTLPFTKVGQRFHTMITAAKERRYDTVFSQRMPGVLTAWDMFRNHPFVGVGPGAYKYLFRRYRVALSAEYPEQWTRSLPLSFSEAHNDHLQILAETGLPGYVLFLAALATVAFRRGRATVGADQAARFARILRVPMVIAIAIVALAQFPLQIAATRTELLYFAAIAVTWDE